MTDKIIILSSHINNHNIILETLVNIDSNSIESLILSINDLKIMIMKNNSKLMKNWIKLMMRIQRLKYY